MIKHSGGFSLDAISSTRRPASFVMHHRRQPAGSVHQFLSALTVRVRLQAGEPRPSAKRARQDRAQVVRSFSIYRTAFQQAFRVFHLQERTLQRMMTTDCSYKILGALLLT